MAQKQINAHKVAAESSTPSCVDLQMETIAEHRRREAYQKKRWRREWEQDAENKPAPVPAKEAEDAEMGEEEEEALLSPAKK